MTPAITRLDIGDPPAAWAALGFTVAGNGSAAAGGIEFRLDPAVGKGIRGWTVRGATGMSPVFEGIPTEDGGGDNLDQAPSVGSEHPNGVIGLDHVVLLTPDLDRTLANLEKAGSELRRVRDTDTYGAPMRQAFFRMGPTILEVIGAPEKTGDGGARFFGLAWTVRDLDATAAYLGDRLRPAKNAVQEGRRIATLDKAAGSTVAMAFMSPEPA